MLAKALGLVAVVWGTLLMINRKNEIKNSGQRLSFSERFQIIIICFFSPVLSGLVFYYGWRESLPVMAKQARSIAIMMLLIELVLGVGIGYLIFFAK